MRRLLTAVLLANGALLTAADWPPDVWFSPCEGPGATCVAPHVDHRLHQALVGWSSEPICTVRRASGCGSWMLDELAQAGSSEVPSPFYDADGELSEPAKLREIADDAPEVLSRWEEASKAFAAVTDAERMRLRFSDTKLSGQQLNLVCEFKQPIDAAELERRYEWTTLNEHGNAVRLTAVPKDPLERLFYNHFVVSLDASTGRPTGLDFGGVIHEGGAVSSFVTLRPWIDDTNYDIRLAGFESEPGESSPLRTADVSDDAPRRLDDEDFVTPPPAPRSIDCRVPVEAPKPPFASQPAALREVLQNFDRFCRETNRLELELYCWDYEFVFQSEKRSQLHLFVEKHKTGWMEALPATGAWAAAPTRDGLKLREATSDGWRWSEELITRYDPTSNAKIESVNRRELGLAAVLVPEKMFPIWSVPSARSLTSQFDLALSRTDRKNGEVIVTAAPKAGSDYDRFLMRDVEFDFVFETHSGIPKAMQVTQRSSRRVYSVQEIAANGPRPPIKALKPR